MAEKQPELDGMPEATIIVRLNGEQDFEELADFDANDEVTLTGVKGVIKKRGIESYKATGTRPFLQIHVTEFGGVKLR